MRVDNTSKDELYSAAREWVATAFNSATDVLKMDDRVSGKLVAKGFANIYIKTGIMPIKEKFYFTVKIYCKENRYRVIWTDLQTQSYPDKWNYNPAKVSADYSLLNPYKEDGYTPQIVRSSIKEAIIQKIEAFNEEIEQIMTKPISSDESDDW